MDSCPTKDIFIFSFSKLLVLSLGLMLIQLAEYLQILPFSILLEFPWILVYQECREESVRDWQFCQIFLVGLCKEKPEEELGLDNFVFLLEAVLLSNYLFVFKYREK